MACVPASVRPAHCTLNALGRGPSCPSSFSMTSSISPWTVRGTVLAIPLLPVVTVPWARKHRQFCFEAFEKPVFEKREEDFD